MRQKGLENSWGILLVFYSKQPEKSTFLSSVRGTDKQTDGQTRSIAKMPPVGRQGVLNAGLVKIFRQLAQCVAVCR